MYFVLARFLFGYSLTAIYIFFAQKNSDSAKEYNFSLFKFSFGEISFWLWVRALGNTIAVFFFFMAVSYGNVTNANFFNMLYPAFVAVFSPWLLSEKNTLVSWLGILFSITGAYLIVHSNEAFVFTPADWFGILSAAFASIAVVALRKLRKEECSTARILLFTFQTGSVISLAVVFIYIFYYGFSLSPFTPDVSLYLFIAALVGLLGQWTLTYGFRYVTAVHGSILSASRILIALLFGWFFWLQPFHWTNFTGALLIFFANILLAFKGKTK